METTGELSALQRFKQGEKAVQLGAVKATLDLLDNLADDMSGNERHDAAYAVFVAFRDWIIDFEIDSGVHVTDAEFADVWARIVWHVQAHMAVNLAAERWAEDVVVELPDGSILNWHTANREATIIGPGCAVVIIDERPAVLGRAS